MKIQDKNVGFEFQLPKMLCGSIKYAKTSPKLFALGLPIIRSQIKPYIPSFQKLLTACASMYVEI
jgi:hypothetical protein